MTIQQQRLMSDWSQLEQLLYQLVIDYEQGYGFNPNLAKSLLQSGKGDVVCGTLSLLRGANKEGWIIPQVLFDPKVRKSIETVEEVLGWNSTESLRLYQEVVNQQFRDPLTEIAQGREPTDAEIQMLVKTLQVDEVQRAILDIPLGQTAEDVVSERVAIMQQVWPAFSDWWLDYFRPEDSMPADTLWRFYIPLSQWLVSEKRRVCPDGPLWVGVNANQGQGKTVFVAILLVIINILAEEKAEEKSWLADGFSLDDHYLWGEERESLRSLGFDTPEGVTNRFSIGTHNMEGIRQTLRQYEQSTPESVTIVPTFDKASDRPGKSRRVEGTVGLVIVDGCAVAANTRFNLEDIPPAHTFERVIGQNLQQEYKSLFDSFHVVLVFEPLTFEAILQGRERQEQNLERRTGKRGMNPEQIINFVDYYSRRPWYPGVTSPTPLIRDTTFLMGVDTNYCFVRITRGGRPVV